MAHLMGLGMGRLEAHGTAHGSVRGTTHETDNFTGHGTRTETSNAMPRGKYH